MSDLNLAVVGVGRQGRTLIDGCLAIPGVRVKAVCDIRPSHLDSAREYLRGRRQEPCAYAEFGEMLAGEKDLQAVLIATPDGCHADQTVACLKAGLHVYCEAEMHHTLEGCRRMVLAARESGRLLQIGRQKRSSPHYRLALEHIEQKGSVGRVTHVSGQWRGRIAAPQVAEGQAVPESVLNKHGYRNMEELANWRHSPQFSAGPLATLGNHQIDLFHWFLRGPPRAIVAAGDVGGSPAARIAPAICLLEWEFVREGVPSVVRGDQHVLTSDGGCRTFETVYGDEGVLIIAENVTFGGIGREIQSPETAWETENATLLSRKIVPRGFEEDLTSGPSADMTIEEEKRPALRDLDAPWRFYSWQPSAAELKPAHLLHLENFFDAIRGNAKLTCPAEVAYPTAVTVLRAAEAMRTRRRLVLAPDEFVV